MTTRPKTKRLILLAIVKPVKRVALVVMETHETFFELAIDLPIKASNAAAWADLPTGPSPEHDATDPPSAHLLDRTLANRPLPAVPYNPSRQM
jgi:hypothetical protein